MINDYTVTLMLLRGKWSFAKTYAKLSASPVHAQCEYTKGINGDSFALPFAYV